MEGFVDSLAKKLFGIGLPVEYDTDITPTRGFRHPGWKDPAGPLPNQETISYNAKIVAVFTWDAGAADVLESRMGMWLAGVTSGLMDWFANVGTAVVTVAQALRVTMRYWIVTSDPRRRTFTERYEYPELPTQLAPRFRGFHRFDLTKCIACDRCAKDCPVDCIYIGKERAVGRKGFKITSYTIDYTKCMFCALCTESCPADCIYMGSSYDLSSFSRDDCIVDFSRLPLEIAWGQSTLNPMAVRLGKQIAQPVHEGPSK